MGVFVAPGTFTIIIADGKHSYDLEYQLPTEAPSFPTSFSSVASRLLLSRARHRRHPDLLLRRIRRSIIREILANVRRVRGQSIGKRLVRH